MAFAHSHDKSCCSGYGHSANLCLRTSQDPGFNICLCSTKKFQNFCVLIILHEDSANRVICKFIYLGFDMIFVCSSFGFRTMLLII